MLLIPGDSEMAGQQKGTEGNQLGEFLIVGLSPDVKTNNEEVCNQFAPCYEQEKYQHSK